MKKFLFVIQSLKNMSGTERVAATLANLFVKNFDCKVIIVNQEAKKEECPYFLENNVQVVRSTGNFFKFAIDVQKIIRDECIDYVLIHNMGRLSLLMSFLKKYKSSFISLEHVSFISRPKIIRLLSRILYRRLDKIVTLTDVDLEQYKKFIKINDIKRIYNICCFPIERIPFENRENLVIAVGRLTYQKNFSALISAWALIDKKLPNFRLEIYGEGEERINLQRIIEEKNLYTIKLMGNSMSILDVYKKAICFVMSSRYEGLPMVLIEAQTLGLPIVSFNCPTGPDEIIIQDRNGILVENQNVNELSKSLLGLLSDRNKLKLYSERAIVDAERFQKEKILDDWKDIFFS